MASALALAPTFVLVFFRLAGMMLFAPLFGSSRIPKRLRVLLIAVLSMGICGGVRPVSLPESTWELAIGIGGEMAFGVAMGMVMSFTFIAAQWAGEMIGQQMGLNLSEVFDPQFGAQGSIIGELYFMLTLVVFLSFQGHHDMLLGVRASFDHLPLLSLTVDQPVLDLIVRMFGGATAIALRLAAPMLVTMLVVDLALGLIGRAMPQFNAMQAGMSMKSIIGLIVIIIGLGYTAEVIRQELGRSAEVARENWRG